VEWVVNLIIYYAVAICIWPAKRYNPVHIIWVVPLFCLFLITLAFIVVPILRP
jgi:hypothetical protein